MEQIISFDFIAPYLVPGLFGFFMLYLVLSVVFSLRRIKKEHQYLTEYSKSKGYKYPGVSKAFMGGYSSINLFSRGSRPSIESVVNGKLRGVEFEIFNFSYRTGGRKNKTSRYITVFASIFEGKSIPRFVLTPEGMFEKLAGVLGCQDIDFPEHPSFSRAFKLSGENEELIKKVFTFPVLEELCKRKDLSMEGQGEILMFFVDYKKLPVSKWESFIEECASLSQMFRV